MRFDPDILNLQFDFDPFCKFWLPFLKYGAEQSKIWDQSGNGNHGVISGAVPAISVDEEFGWYFDGSDDRVVHPAINLGKLHTLNYWIKRIGDNGNVHAGGLTYCGLRISDTTVGYSSASTVAETHNGPASTAKKTLISITRILDKVNFFQDGLHIGEEQTLEQSDNLTLTDFGRYSNGTDYFNGVIYQAVGYTRIFPAVEIKNYYEMTRLILGA